MNDENKNAFNLFMIRHAPVLHPKGMIYGDKAVIDLKSEPVKEQLSCLARNIPHINESYWLNSGVERAFETALTIHNLQNKKVDFDIVNDIGFREQNFGDLIGLSHEDANGHLSFIDGKIAAPTPPNGESVEVFISRVGTAIENVKKEMLERNFSYSVIFCHGGTIRAANVYLNRLKIEDFIRLDTPPLGMHVFRGAYQSNPGL